MATGTHRTRRGCLPRGGSPSGGLGRERPQRPPHRPLETAPAGRKILAVLGRRNTDFTEKETMNCNLQLSIFQHVGLSMVMLDLSSLHPEACCCCHCFCRCFPHASSIAAILMARTTATQLLCSCHHCACRQCACRRRALTCRHSLCALAHCPPRSGGLC